MVLPAAVYDLFTVEQPTVMVQSGFKATGTQLRVGVTGITRIVRQAASAHSRARLRRFQYRAGDRGRRRVRVDDPRPRGRESDVDSPQPVPDMTIAYTNWGASGYNCPGGNLDCIFCLKLDSRLRSSNGTVAQRDLPLAGT